MKFKLAILIILLATFTGATAKVASYYRTQKRAEQQKAAAQKKAEEVKITIIEGWTLEDITQYLQKQELVDGNEFIKAAQNFIPNPGSILDEKPTGASLEGFLFPDTYRITKREKNASNTPLTANEIVGKMTANLEKKFTPTMRADAKSKGMSVYDILILASIIERETGRNITSGEGRQQLLEERKIIAGIFYNRLNANMALASDATINYLTKKNDPQATLKDLEIDSPYNTYKYKGLPPGPICNPSESSLIAAVYPTASDYYFFLHTQPEGKAIYSKTFEEHLANKQKYLK